MAEGNSLKSTKNFSLHVEWCLSNIRSTWKRSDPDICSPVFSLDPHNEAAWTMLLTPNVNKYWLSITFKNQSGKPRCTTNFIVDILFDEKKNNISSLNVTFKPSQHRRKIDVSTNCISVRSLTIVLKNNLPEDHDTTCPFSHVFSQPLLVKEISLQRDFGTILKEAKFSDITLRADDQEIKAHKTILSGRSAVFNSMFELPMKESMDRCVDISDISFETLQHFASYLYSGTLDSEAMSVELASDLLEAADKYAVEDLLVICSEFLMKSLNADNCLDILLLADVHSKSDLKTAAMKAFVENCQKICEKSNWDDRLMVRPNLYSELLKAMALKLKSFQ